MAQTRKPVKEMPRSHTMSLLLPVMVKASHKARPVSTGMGIRSHLFFFLLNTFSFFTF